MLSMFSTAASADPAVLVSIVSSDAKESESSSSAAESKAVLKTTHLVNSLMNRTHTKKKNGFLNKKPQRTRIFSTQQTSTSASGAAGFASINPAWQAATFPDVANLSALYDECRVLGGTLHYLPVSLGSGNAHVSYALAVAFDPIASAPTSVGQVCVNSYSTGPRFMTSNTTIYTWDLPYHKLRFKMPGPLAPITGSDIPGSSWFAVDSGTAPILANIQVATDAQGGTGQNRIFYYLELDIEMRIRV